MVQKNSKNSWEKVREAEALQEYRLRTQEYTATIKHEYANGNRYCEINMKPNSSYEVSQRFRIGMQEKGKRHTEELLLPVDNRQIILFDMRDYIKWNRNLPRDLRGGALGLLLKLEEELDLERRSSSKL